MVIETPRLLIRKFTANDASFIYTLMNTPNWLRFIGDRGIHSEKDAGEHIKSKLMADYKALGFGFWCVIEKSSGSAIGMNGLIKRESLDDVDLGFAFLPKFTGKGYAYESSRVILDYAKDILNLDKLIAITDQDNTRSQALLEKLEFISRGVVTVKKEWGESILYEKQLSL